MSKKAIIIGAGPAGLTAAYELLKRTDIKPIVLERSGDIGGISKTINYKGNRMDIGGHRFFSKSDRVMNWWLNIMPLQKTDGDATITYQNKSRTVAASGTNSDPGKVMLLRKRLSRIYFLRKFFTYPIQLSIDTLRKLGVIRTFSILLSYIYAQLRPRKPELSLEDFLINRFGRQLYLLFFKDYTEKVWGVPCNEISAEWGAQRIKGVSISKAIRHAAKQLVKKRTGDISQKGTETSLIEQFLYPALGPGQLWEEVARQVVELGGEIRHYEHVKEIQTVNGSVASITSVNTLTGEETVYEGNYFFSTMPIKELIGGINGAVPGDVREIAAGLQYRDFITVGVLLEKLSASLEDTWIYIQERDVKVGRLQLFNNWSPYMVSKPGAIWIGMEYFCNEGDEFWSLSDEEIKRTAIAELEKMGLAQVSDVLDSTVQRVEKTYPAYFGTYNRFDRIREYVDGLANLFLVGRNGMHKYNNADHSMLTAMTAVDNIVAGVDKKDNVWAINTEMEYHEEKEREEEKKQVQRQVLNDHNPALGTMASFKEFVFNNKRNKTILWLAVIAIFIQFAVFKYFYPFASFINGDSYNYIETAYFNWTVNTYPVGYSNFLRIFSAFTKSDTILVAFQYALIQSSLLTLLFTIFYFFKVSRVVQIFLLSFLILNPVFLYLANYVSSDVIFIALTTLWFTLLLWIIHRNRNWMIVVHAFLVFILFTFRYNALFYPIVSAVAFYLAKNWGLSKKVFGLAAGLMLIGIFIFHTGNGYKKLTGQWQFSPFSGWQLANNALYAYRYVDKADRVAVPAPYEKLHAMVNTYFDTTRNLEKYPQETLIANTMYMWDERSPLYIFQQNKFYKDTSTTTFRKWAAMGPMYSEYGWLLIKQYPKQFLLHYLWPNTMKFYAPPVEFLQQYSTGRASVSGIAQTWFEYKSNKITSRFKDFNVSVLDFLPFFAGGLNILFLVGLFFYLFLQGYAYQPWLNKSLILLLVYWLGNFAFSVFASPIALRFQLFSIVLSVVFGALFIEFLVKVARQNHEEGLTTQEGSYQLSGY